METHHSTQAHSHSIPVENCYQCGKCTAGCPMAEEMDLMPNQIIRLAQLGQEDRAAQSQAIWLCVSCQTCSARCPKSVDCAGVMDEMRQLSLEKSTYAAAQQRTVLFQLAFLQNIKKFGRLNELELIRSFKTAAFFKDLNVPMLFKDALLAPELLKRKKLHITGEKVKDRSVVTRIFERCQK
jgi:heterodisulfide reductase subunit C2